MGGICPLVLAREIENPQRTATSRPPYLLDSLSLLLPFPLSVPGTFLSILFLLFSSSFSLSFSNLFHFPFHLSPSRFTFSLSLFLFCSSLLLLSLSLSTFFLFPHQRGEIRSPYKTTSLYTIIEYSETNGNSGEISPRQRKGHGQCCQLRTAVFPAKATVEQVRPPNVV